MFVFFVLHFASRSKTKERRILESLEKLFFGKKSLPKIYDKSFLRPQGGFAGGKCTLTFFLLRINNPYSFTTTHLPKNGIKWIYVSLWCRSKARRIDTDDDRDFPGNKSRKKCGSINGTRNPVFPQRERKKKKILSYFWRLEVNDLGSRNPVKLGEEASYVCEISVCVGSVVGNFNSLNFGGTTL